MNAQVTRPRSIVRPLTMALAWCGSAASLIAGLTMYFLATNESTRIQIAAGSGEITDPIDYYGPLTSAQSMSSLSVILIGVGALALVLCLLATALLPWRSELTFTADYDTTDTDIPTPYPATDILEAESNSATLVVDEVVYTPEPDSEEAIPAVIEATDVDAEVAEEASTTDAEEIIVEDDELVVDEVVVDEVVVDEEDEDDDEAKEQPVS